MRSASKDQIIQDRLKLENPYAHLNGDGEFEALAPNPENGLSDKPNRQSAAAEAPVLIQTSALIQKARTSHRYQKSEVEHAAQQLQREMWRNRTYLCEGEKDISNPLEIIQPSLAFRSIGMSFELQESLGQYVDRHGTFEVAGIIAPRHKQVWISRRFPPHIRNFTAAHELGHAVLHGGTTLHRDRPLDGTVRTCGRTPRELEADQFAAAFLMPRKQIRAAFERRFYLAPLPLNDDVAFALESKSQDVLRRRLTTTRDFARLIATARFFGGAHFPSLTDQFDVSAETMAIRLEELNLVCL